MKIFILLCCCLALALARPSHQLHKRQTTAEGHVEKDKEGNTHAGGSVSHTSDDGNTKSEAHVDHSSNEGTSYGGSFSHTFGGGGLDSQSNSFGKRQTTAEGHAGKDKNGNTHVGGSVSHTSDDGNTRAEGHVDHSSNGGTSYGASGSHTWSHSDGSKTTVSGGANHGSKEDSVGVSVTHTFGRRLVELEQALKDIQTRQTTAEGHVEKDKDGNTHAGGSVSHTSDDGNTKSEAHVDHSSNEGTSYGGSVSHTFGG